MKIQTGRPRARIPPCAAIRAAVLLIASLWSAGLGAQERTMRQTLDFSGYVWNIRQSEEPGGPLDNRFAGRDRSIFLRSDGALEIKASYEGGLWYGGEVSTVKRLGFGTYTFRLRSDLSRLDRNLVLGLFTYSRSAADNHSEIDIEFSSWGNTRNPPLGQFVVQPYDREGHMVRFGLSDLGERSSFRFEWRADRIEFSSWKGYGPRPEAGSALAGPAWVYQGPQGIPPGSRANLFINLYFAGPLKPDGGRLAPAPAGSGELSVLIDAFEFAK